MEITYTKWNLANRFDNHIELNENLKKYPDLHSQILSHELGHTDAQGFTMKDFKHDLSSQDLNYRQLIIFMLKHPRCLTQFFPFYYSSKRHQFVYDLNLLIIYSVFFMIILGSIVLSNKFI